MEDHSVNSFSWDLTGFSLGGWAGEIVWVRGTRPGHLVEYSGKEK